MTIGRKEPDAHLQSVLKTIGINECCSIVFTVSIICVLQHDTCSRQTVNLIHTRGTRNLLSEVVYSLQYYTHFILIY